MVLSISLYVSKSLFPNPIGLFFCKLFPVSLTACNNKYRGLEFNPFVATLKVSLVKDLLLSFVSDQNWSTSSQYLSTVFEYIEPHNSFCFSFSSLT